MSEPRDTRLRAIFRSGREGAQPRPDCPAPEQIWKAVRLELPLAERIAIIDHTTECPVCAELWQLGTEVGRAHPTAAAARPWWLLSAAAMLVLAIGVGYLVRSQQTPEIRTPAGSTLESQVPENVALPRDDFWLRWTPGPPGSRYSVTVTTPDLNPVAEVRDLDATEYRVPLERLNGLAPGTRLLWRVVANTPEGTAISSRTLAVSVR